MITRLDLTKLERKIDTLQECVDVINQHNRVLERSLNRLVVPCARCGMEENEDVGDTSETVLFERTPNEAEYGKDIGNWPPDYDVATAPVMGQAFECHDCLRDLMDHHSDGSCKSGDDHDDRAQWCIHCLAFKFESHIGEGKWAGEECPG